MFRTVVNVSLSVIVLSALSALHAAAGPKKPSVDRAVRDAMRAGAATHKVIITTVSAECRAAIRDALQRHGDVVSSEQPLIEGVAGEMHSRDVDEIANHPCVKSVATDATVRASAAPPAKKDKKLTRKEIEAARTAPAPSQTLTSTLRDTLGLPHYAALDPSVPTGSGGIGIAILDSGIAPSADFSWRITAFYDFTRGGRAAIPYDDYGHGTHIAGLIGSSGVLSNYEFQGVAPDVRLVGLKVLDKTGAGKTSDVISAIEFVIANRFRLNVQVINLSLGHPIYAPAADDPLVQAVEKATAAGLIVVASAGNFGQKQSDGTVGYAGITSPGNAPSAITVGAAMTKDTVTRLDDEVAPYSSRGPTWFDARVKPDVVAPGHHLASDTNLSSHLYTLLQKNHYQSKNGQPLLFLSGSSMSAAVTSGVVALVLQAHNENPFRRQPALTPNLVKGILQYSAISIAGADHLTQGAGQINAAGAIALGEGIDTAKPIGAQWLTGVAAHSLIGGISYPWAQHILYGDRALGGGVLSANNIVWSTNIVWGTVLTEDDNIVWGTIVVEDDNIVWGTADGEDDNIVWGTNIVWSTRVIGQRVDGTNIVWGSNIVWGANIVWGTLESDNIVWGTMTEDDNIVWGTAFGGDIVWGTAVREGFLVRPMSFAEEDNIVWGSGGGL